MIPTEAGFPCGCVGEAFHKSFQLIKNVMFTRSHKLSAKEEEVIHFWK